MSEIMHVKDIPDLKQFLNDDNLIEICIRNKNKKFKAFQKISLDKLQKNESQKEIANRLFKSINKNNKVNVKNMNLLNNIKMLNDLNLLLNGLNLCATCVGFAIVCHKIDKISEQISEVLSTIKTSNDLRLDFEFNKCISEHSNMLDHRKTQDYFSVDRMEKMVSSEYDVLEMLVKHYISEVVNDKGTLLYSIMTMAAMLEVSLKYYDEMYYFEYKDKINNNELWHTSHDKWLSIYDKIASDDFIKAVQNYGFLNLHLSARECDALWVNVKDSSLSYKQAVIDNQELLKILEVPELLNELNNQINIEVENQIRTEINNLNNLEVDDELNALFNNAMADVGIIA